MNAIVVQQPAGRLIASILRPMTIHRLIWGTIVAVVIAMLGGTAAIPLSERPGYDLVVGFVVFSAMASFVFIRQRTLSAIMVLIGLTVFSLINGYPEIGAGLSLIGLINMYRLYVPKQPPDLGLLFSEQLNADIEWEFRALTPPWKGTIEKSCPRCNKPRSLVYGKMFELTEDPSSGGIKDKSLAVPRPLQHETYKCDGCSSLFYEHVDAGGD